MVKWEYMKTTLELPDDLIKDIKLRAIHEGKKLKNAIADLLRKGLAARPGGQATKLTPGKRMLKRRKEITRKFISGEWGVELTGFEKSRAADRRKTGQRNKAWRD